MNGKRVTSSRSVLVALPFVLFSGLVILFVAGLDRDNPDALPSAMIGRSAPALATTPLGSDRQIDEAVLAQPGTKIVNFWASWCAPCRAEHPNLETLNALGIPVIGVNYKDDDAKALRFLAELGNPYHAIGADTDGRVAIEWGAYGVPETFVIDTEGRIVLRHAGPVTQRTLREVILPALGESR